MRMVEGLCTVIDQEHDRRSRPLEACTVMIRTSLRSLSCSRFTSAILLQRGDEGLQPGRPAAHARG